MQDQRKPDDESGFRIEAALGALGPMGVDDEETTDFAFEVAQGPEALAPVDTPARDMPTHDPYVLDGRSSVYIPGPLHISSNIIKAFKNVIVCWQLFIPILESTSRLLSNAFFRTRSYTVHGN